MSVKTEKYVTSTYDKYYFVKVSVGLIRKRLRVCFKRAHEAKRYGHKVQARYWRLKGAQKKC